MHSSPAWSRRRRGTVATLLACALGACAAGAGREVRDGHATAAGQGAVVGERRIALVIGNGSYEHVADLDNAAADARSIAAALAGHGFTLVGGQAHLDLTRLRLLEVIAEFAREASGATDARPVALFYYAGHAIQTGGSNHFAPVDAQLTSQAEVSRQMVPLQRVLAALPPGESTNIVILDACRNDPFTASGGRGLYVGGLAATRAPPGTLLAYSTAPGRAASDGEGDAGHSPYTRELLAAMERPGLRLEDVFMHVRQAVTRDTGGSQVPWEQSSLDRPFFFDGAAHDSLEDRCHQAGDPDACFDLASRLDSMERPYDAIALYARACEQAHHHACLALSGALRAQQLREPPERPLARAQAACDAGVVPGCVALGRLYELGVVVERSFQRAHDLYTAACEAGDGYGCSYLGGLYAAARGVERDPERAMSLLETACDGGVQDGCAGMGSLYQTGRGIEQDLDRARELFESSCLRGSMRGCSALGRLYSYGDGVERDMERARALYERACEGGNLQGCSSLGVLYGTGRGVSIDLARALQLQEYACEGGSMAGCSNLGVLYFRGRGVERDPIRARVLFERACEGAHARSCYNLAVAERGSATPDAERARSLFDQACEAGFFPGCTALGQILLADDSTAVAQAAQHFTRGCEGGDATGCAELAELLSSPADPSDRDRALTLFTRACERGDAWSCRRLVGFGAVELAARRVTAAAASFDAGCSGGSTHACVERGLMRSEGEGEAPNREAALALWTDACESGNRAACLLRSTDTTAVMRDIALERADPAREVGCRLLVVHDAHRCAFNASCSGESATDGGYGVARVDPRGGLLSCRAPQGGFALDLRRGRVAFTLAERARTGTASR